MDNVTYALKDIHQPGGVVICHINHWQNWSEFQTCFNDYVDLTADLAQPIHFVIHFDKVSVPQPWPLDDVYRFMTYERHPLQKTIFVNAPYPLKTFMRIAQRVYNVWQTEQQFVFVSFYSRSRSNP